MIEFIVKWQDKFTDEQWIKINERPTVSIKAMIKNGDSTSLNKCHSMGFKFNLNEYDFFGSLIDLFANPNIDGS